MATCRALLTPCWCLSAGRFSVINHIQFDLVSVLLHLHQTDLCVSVLFNPHQRNFFRSRSLSPFAPLLDSCTRIFVSIFSYSQYITSSPSSIAQKTHTGQASERARGETAYRDVQCVLPGHSIFLLVFLLLPLPLSLFSTTINIVMTFVPIIALHTFAHNTIWINSFQSITNRPACLPSCVYLNIHRHPSFTSQAKRKRGRKSLDVFNKY